MCPQQENAIKSLSTESRAIRIASYQVRTYV